MILLVCAKMLGGGSLKTLWAMEMTVSKILETSRTQID